MSGVKNILSEITGMFCCLNNDNIISFYVSFFVLIHRKLWLNQSVGSLYLFAFMVNNWISYFYLYLIFISTLWIINIFTVKCKLFSFKQMIINWNLFYLSTCNWLIDILLNSNLCMTFAGHSHLVLIGTLCFTFLLHNEEWLICVLAQRRFLSN